MQECMVFGPKLENGRARILREGIFKREQIAKILIEIDETTKCNQRKQGLEAETVPPRIYCPGDYLFRAFKFDCVQRMSESQYEADQDPSEQDFDIDESHGRKLRPSNRQRNYQSMNHESKPPEEKRQTRGTGKHLPTEIINMHVGDRENNQNRLTDLGSDFQEGDQPKEEDDEFSIFNIEISQFLWRRKREKTDQDEYLVKYKGKSYLHTEWLTELEIQALGKNVKNKINRFNKIFSQRLLEGSYDEEAIEEGKYFDPTYLEVDRILMATEMFPVIHQKKANQIKGKWSESIMLVCSKLLNFTKNEIHYGVLFCEPVDPQRDNCPQYLKIVTQPMDLGTIMNKIYLDLYKSTRQFWIDIGLVWRNCLKYNKEETSDLHVLGLTLRECTIFLYDQWYHLSEKRYQAVAAEFENNKSKEESKEKQLDNTGKSIVQSQNGQNDIIKEEPNEEDNKGQDVSKAINTVQAESEVKQEKIEEQINEKIEEEAQYENQNSVSQENMEAEQNIGDDSSSRKKSQKKPQSIEEQKDYLDMEEFYKHNIFLTQKKVQPPNTKEQLQLLNPGEFSYFWLDEQEGKGQKFMQHTYDHIDITDMRSLDLNKEVNRLYMVKWKNLSYSEATWELQTAINCPQKINEFKHMNKALGKEARTAMDQQRQKHRILIDLELYPKKKSRYTNFQLSQIKNKLYFYDIGQKKQPFQYKPENPQIYRNYKMLRSYQIESVNWLIKSWYQKRNTILADEMGLGKTIQSIAFLYHLFNVEGVKGPFLIIAPLSTLQHWKRTVEEWTTMNCILYYDQNGSPGRRSIQYYEWNHMNITMRGMSVASQLNKFQVLITSYEVFLLDFNEVIMNIPIQFIVVDEAHRLKNKNAKILTALKRLPCKRVLLLTGTPIQNNTGQLWSLLNYINPERFSHFEEFKRNFGDLSSNEQVQKLNKILKPYMLRRMKQDVQQSIPPLQQTIIDVQMTNVQKTIYKALYEKNKEMLIKGLASSTSCNANLNNLQIQLRKCCNHPFLIKELEFDLLKNCGTGEQRMEKLISASGKMVLVKKLLEKCKAEGKKVLIFSQFTHMLQIIQDFLRWKDYKYERIDGQIKAKERQAAIDRYNNPSKNRDVFLLSTKAGGVGINLTSANVVIIYDSDWNPQNDVQATARAHRIGQKSQVQVYRLITCNTYETQMFERATQKLGLDKAIFIGGNFKQAGETTIPSEAKLSKNQMETLLKKGILGFLENQGQEHNAEQFFNQNVDEIIQKNSRIAKYSLINMSCSFSKSRFVSQNSDNQLKIDDPNFWNIVLKNVQSPTQLLLKKFKNNEYNKSIEGQKQLMLQASQQMNILIQNKLSRNNLNTDDQINLSEFLTLVNAQRTFHKFYRDLASSWLEEIYKPSRRFKKLTIQDLTIPAKGAVQKKAVNLRSNDEGDNIYAEEEEEQEDQEGSEDKIKMDDLKKDEYLKKLCALCEKPKCTIYCKSFCKRAFHQQCKKKMEIDGIASYENISGKFEPKELTMDHETVKNLMNVNVVCSDCSQNLVACVVCKVKGHYYGAEYKKTKKGKAKKEEEFHEEITTKNKKKNEVTKCSTANCAKYFHPKCIDECQTKKHFKFIDTNSLHFRCSLHYCNVCGVSGDTMSIFQCVRCPKALHTRCMDKEKIVKVSKKQFICDSHFKNKKQLKKISDRFNIPTNPASQASNTLKKYLKTQKAEAKKKEKPESEDQQEVEVNHSYSTRRNKHTPQEASNAANNIQERGKSKPKEKIINLTYQDLGLTPIKDFDYSHYAKDWCRYCGCRYSSNFTQGPWGPKTLCTVHYINWKQAKTLDLSSHDTDQKPTRPIDPENDQQLKFLSSIAQKNPQLRPMEIIPYIESKKNSKKGL